MNTTATSEKTPVPPTPRACGDCAMCCKLPEIPPLNKPYNTWCSHCSTRTTCDIYATRPQMCRDFQCYFTISDLGEEWRPNKSRLLISVQSGVLVVAVDPSRPDAWRKPEFFPTITHWSTQIPVHVLLNGETHVVFPDHVDYLGVIDDDHQIMTLEEITPNGMRKRAVRVHKSEVPADMRVGIPYPTDKL